jgi:hypothetical protein
VANSSAVTSSLTIIDFSPCLHIDEFHQPSVFTGHRICFAVGHLEVRKVVLRVRRLASACPVKCEAYFTGAAPCKRRQWGGLKRFGLCNPMTSYQLFIRSFSNIKISQAPHSEMGPLRYLFYDGAVFEQPADGVAGSR